MAAALVLAVAPYRKISLPRQRREHGERAFRRRLGHLASISLGKSLPPPWRPGLGGGKGQKLVARRDFWKPQVEIVALRVVGFLHAARQAPHGTKARAFSGNARVAQPHDAHRHLAADARHELAFSRMGTNSSAAGGWVPIVGSKLGLVGPRFTPVATRWVTFPAFAPVL